MLLGISLYPEQEKIEDIENYIRMASSYGFSKIFTSLFSVDGTKEEIIQYFQTFTSIAHQYNMQVSGDVNHFFFEKMGASPTDLSVFCQMGMDIIRMDMSFNDERDAILINNQQGIGIEMSTGFISVIENAIANGADPKRISTCHNFYPQRYSAPSLETINELNNYWHNKGIPVAIFISSNVKGSHGPWPVSDGLPTIEEHRDLPIQVQLKHCLALKNVDEIRIGNAYASKEEFEAIDRVMKIYNANVDKLTGLGPLGDYLPSGNLHRIPLQIHLEKGITSIEKAALFDFPVHCDMGDCLNYMLRSRMTRIIYKDANIPVRQCSQEYYRKGDVVIVNNNLKHYLGEIQIVMKDMKVDGQRNLLGRIDENEIVILDHFQAHDIFTFYE